MTQKDKDSKCYNISSARDVSQRYTEQNEGSAKGAVFRDNPSTYTPNTSI